MTKNQRILNILPSKNIEKDWTIENAIGASLIPKKAALPSSKDLRETWWKPGNQGSTGSCVGWALAEGTLRWYFVKTKKITKTDRLSPRYIWMASKELDTDNSKPTSFLERSGTFLKDALDIARKYGVAKESDLPFNGNLNDMEEEDFFAKISLLKISSYYNLVKSGKKIDNIKKWIASTGPVFASLICDESFMDLGKKGELKNYKGGGEYGGHAVSIVGYTANQFIIRNSWGPTWGKDGFGFASSEYIDAAFDEAYGIVV